MGWTRRTGSIKGVQRTISPFETNGRDGQAGQKAILMESIGHPILSISPLGTKVSDGQAGLKAELKESIGHPLKSISPLMTKGMNGQAGLC